ncbi:MAG TPA: ATP-binding cassette domain-containing protein [Terriglobia bacterium]|nr:ATP-binding cassette domain-containing protein [Terriglobia bacterium]
MSFQVSPGEIFGLLGPNGGGKTSLFRILTTLLPPSGGRARIWGWDVVRSPHQVRRRIGVVFQAQNLDRKLTVSENLRHQGHLYGLRGATLRQRSSELLHRLDLADRRNDRVETLSGGQRRRVEIAKGLLHRPGLLLLDEPSTGLDPGARRLLWEYLRSLQAEDGVTLLLTTHLLEEAEKCDRLGILDRGRLVALGPPEVLKAEVGGEVIWVDTPDPAGLGIRVRERFRLEGSVIGGKFRFEHPRGHEFIPTLVEAFPGEIRAVRLSRPSLEDVFIRRTGRAFWEENSAGSLPPERLAD